MDSPCGKIARYVDIAYFFLCDQLRVGLKNCPPWCTGMGAGWGRGGGGGVVNREFTASDTSGVTLTIAS